jgi:hypothetical protein
MDNSGHVRLGKLDTAADFDFERHNLAFRKLWVGQAPPPEQMSAELALTK